MDRRKFLGISGIGIAGIGLFSRCNNHETDSPWRFFTVKEAAVIDAMCGQIIPADQDAGAQEANVVNFIDKQLVKYYKELRDTYRKGITGVLETSRIEYGKDFDLLGKDEQYKILELLESGKARGETWKSMSSSDFFGLVCEHTMQGFYGSPKHGGNKNYVSYKMLGLDTPIIIGQNRYNNPITH
jgi:gluconate 2-dehydrogenase gamma chain